MASSKQKLSRTAKCIRNTSSWASVKYEYRFDNPKYSPKQIRENIKLLSPKVAELIKRIRALDAQDLKNENTKFKHFIFSDVRGLAGIKIIGSALLAAGFNLAMKPERNKVVISIPDDSVKLEGSDNFVLLTATPLWKRAIPENTKKAITGVGGVFNSRPNPAGKTSEELLGNIHGEQIRIVVGDSGFKEGVDLFDVKYVHIMEPQMSQADLTQAIGRATRTCGQAGLNFVPNEGWTLRVFEYDLLLPRAIEGTNARTAHELLLDVGKVDTSQIRTIAEMQKLNDTNGSGSGSQCGNK